MVVWPKPCESRSSPGFTPKTPLLTQRGFSLCAGNTGSAGRWPATRWRYIARYIRATRGCPLRGGMAPTKVGGYQQQAHTAIACRPAAGTTSRTTPRVDALCEEAWRQPRLAATNSRPTQRSLAGQRPALQVEPRHAWMLSARNHGANQGWHLQLQGDHTQKKRRPCGRRFDLNDAQSSKLDATSPQPGPCPSSLHRGLP